MSEPTRVSDEAILPASGGGSRVRWVICAMLFFATSKNYLDRQVLGILADTLQQQFHWTEAQYGYIIGCFQLAYAIGLTFAGPLIDRIGTRVGYALMMVVWSVASAGHALVHSIFGFGVARFFLGLGEAGNFPAAIKTTAEWFPQKERSFATGIFNAGANVGAILAPLCVPWIAIHYGWRAAFLFVGGLGIVWLAWWLGYYQPPEKHPDISPQEFAYIRAGQSESIEAERMGWRQLLRYRQSWAFMLAKSLTDPIWWFYLYWLPKFLDQRYHLGLSHIGLPLIVIYVLSDMGSVGGGWLPKWFLRHGASIVRARKAALLICALGALPILLVSHTSHMWIVIGILGVVTAAHQGWSANLFTTASDMFPRGTVATIVGMGTLCSSIAAVFFSALVGWVLQLTHSYAPLFALAGFAYLTAMLVMQLLAPRQLHVTKDVVAP
ncbi:MAG TPA: MFS transporter [Acidobacteriaceae bacterium]|jgi:ACS family hexuronate transporter-like MFS transporter|nr:MFS transporter [Acidobacteriaceae bacterium]